MRLFPTYFSSDENLPFILHAALCHKDTKAFQKQFSVLTLSKNATQYELFNIQLIPVSP